MSREVVALLPGGVQRHIGSFNRLVPGFHGTVGEMKMLWDGWVQKLRGDSDNNFLLVSEVVTTDHLDTDDGHEDLLITLRVFLTKVRVFLTEGEGLHQDLGVVVSTSTRSSQPPVGSVCIFQEWIPLSADDRHQQLKSALTRAARSLRDHRPCKAPHTERHMRAREYRCGESCVAGRDYCITHVLGVPMQAWVDAPVCKRPRI